MNAIRGKAGRAAALLAAAAPVAAAAGAAAWLCCDARALSVSPDLADLLLAAAEVGAAVLVARCALGVGLAVAAVAGRRPGCSPGRSATARAAVRLTPGFLRPAVCGLLALSVTTGMAAPALAASNAATLPAAAWSAPSADPPPTAQTPPDVAGGLPAAGWVPAGAAATRPASPHLVTGAPHRTAPSGEVVVHRGDSLWAIVARALGPHARDARVAAEWPRWYAANRSAIGDDPNLLRPGTILRPPSRTAVR